MRKGTFTVHLGYTLQTDNRERAFLIFGKRDTYRVYIMRRVKNSLRKKPKKDKKLKPQKQGANTVQYTKMMYPKYIKNQKNCKPLFTHNLHMIDKRHVPEML